jgi:hypothetical protein
MGNSGGDMNGVIFQPDLSSDDWMNQEDFSNISFSLYRCAWDATLLGSTIAKLP